MSADRGRLARILRDPDAVTVKFGGTRLVVGDDLARVAITRGRQSIAATPTPGTITVDLPADVALPRTGDDVLVSAAAAHPLRFTAAGDQRFAAVPNVRADVGTRAVAQVTDLGPVELRDPDHRQGTRSVVAASIWARFARTVVHGVPFPEGTPDLTILRDAVQLAWNRDPGIRVLNRTAAQIVAPLDRRAESDVWFISWPLDGQTVDQIAGDLIASSGGSVVELRTGQLDWLSTEARDSAPLFVRLGADALAVPLTLTQDTGDLVNDFSAEFGSDNARLVMRGQDLSSMYGRAGLSRQGRYASTVSTKVAGQDATFDLVLAQVSRYGVADWRLSRVQLVDLLDLCEQGRWELAYRLHAIEVGDLVELDGLPTNSPIGPTGLFWVEGVSEVITGRSWTVSLDVVPYGLLATPTRLTDLPISITLPDGSTVTKKRKDAKKRKDPKRDKQPVKINRLPQDSEPGFPDPGDVPIAGPDYPDDANRPQDGNAGWQAVGADDEPHATAVLLGGRTVEIKGNGADPTLDDLDGKFTFSATAAALKGKPGHAIPAGQRNWLSVDHLVDGTKHGRPRDFVACTIRVVDKDGGVTTGAQPEANHGSTDILPQLCCVVRSPAPDDFEWPALLDVFDNTGNHFIRYRFDN